MLVLRLVRPGDGLACSAAGFVVCPASELSSNLLATCVVPVWLAADSVWSQPHVSAFSTPRSAMLRAAPSYLAESENIIEII